MAAFTADYMEVINCLSVAGGVRTKPIKLPEPESLRDAGAPVGKWMGLNRPQESRTEHNIYIFKKGCKVSYWMWCFVQACSPAGYLGGLMSRRILSLGFISLDLAYRSLGCSYCHSYRGIYSISETSRL